MPDTIAEPVVVTGATGFIGRRVVHRLRKDNVAVRALVLPDEPLPDQWGADVDVIRGDIADPVAVKTAVAGAGTVIHLAAVVSDWGDEAMYWALTVEGSRSVFEAAIADNARVVLAASIAVYGDNIHRRACPEESPWGRPMGPYSRTKQAQEKLAWQFYEKNSMQLTVIRPANVYGPGSGPWLHDVVDVLKSGAPGLIGGGNMNAGLAYVDNVADVLVLAAKTDAAIGRVYNCCDGLDVTWRDYFTDISTMIGVKAPSAIPRFAAKTSAIVCERVWRLLHIKKRPPITLEALNLVGSDNRIPIDRMKNELGYVPRVSYDEGLQQTRAYLESIKGENT
ncbi:MAG: NAD-dependent epimerase/dehydratase family protein [Thermodesulfobacteriota bacterium]|nr:NAD-dependent epimerase/dehydratase family protein [Thermodesulfobacteriota bacterium]